MSAAVLVARDDAAASAATPARAESIVFFDAGGVRTAKLIDSHGAVHPGENGYRHEARETPISGLGQLYDELEKIQPNQSIFAVRGALIDGPTRKGIRRLLYADPKTQDVPTLRDVARRWVALDLDGLDLSPGTDVRDLAACASDAAFELPPAFFGCKAIVQASGGHGIKPGMRLRLWYWLSRPVSNAELREWFRGFKVDHALFSAAQPVFTAQPVFAQGVKDHLPRRIDWLPGDEVVQVPDIALPSRAMRFPEATKAPASIKDVVAALAAIANDRADWDRWTLVGMATFASTSGSAEGFAAFAAWSAKYANYDHSKCQERWEHWGSSGPSQLSFGKLWFLANEAMPGWRAPSWAPLNSPAVALAEFEATAVQEHVEFSDDGLGVAFATKHMGQFFYIASIGKWYFFDGMRYRLDEELKAFSFARAVCRDTALRVEAQDHRQALKLSSAQTVAATLRMAASDPVFARSIDSFDNDPWILNCPGGIVDLRTGALRPRAATDLVTKLTGATPGGECPKWLSFLEQITRGDRDLSDFIQRYAGYTLTGTMDQHIFVFLHGPGKNGKGVLMSTLAAALGDYAVSAMETVFTANKGEPHSTELAALRGARMVLISETEEGKSWAEARIKRWTGGDKMSARVMRADPQEFQPQGKLWFAGNHRPVLKNPDDAMRRRLNLVPMKFVPQTPDPGLTEALKAELPGILAWAVRGCLEWQKNKLCPPVAVKTATDDYFADQDLLAQWLAERCEQKEGAETASNVLFLDWTLWASMRGLPRLDARWFSPEMEKRFHKSRSAGGYRFSGVELLPQVATKPGGQAEGGQAEGGQAEGGQAEGGQAEELSAIMGGV